MFKDIIGNFKLNLSKEDGLKISMEKVFDKLNEICCDEKIDILKKYNDIVKNTCEDVRSIEEVYYKISEVYKFIISHEVIKNNGECLSGFDRKLKNLCLSKVDNIDLEMKEFLKKTRDKIESWGIDL